MPCRPNVSESTSSSVRASRAQFPAECALVASWLDGAAQHVAELLAEQLGLPFTVREVVCFGRVVGTPHSPPQPPPSQPPSLPPPSLLPP
eukprot:4984109-Prymnesium_polylepis.1